MEEWEFKAILKISQVLLMFLIPTAVSAGLYLNRYNRRKLKEKHNEEPEVLNVGAINKPKKGRVKKRAEKKK